MCLKFQGKPLINILNKGLNIRRMNTDFSGKIIIITGSSGLIGKEVVKSLCNLNATVIEFDINDTKNKQSKFIKCDITKPDEIDVKIDLILEEYSRIDGLVNLAYPRTKDWGITEFEEVSFSSWEKNIDMQLNCTFYICQKVLKTMRKQKLGSIVNIGSIYGVVGNDFGMYEGTKGTSGIYSAIKGGIINFTKYLAAYYGQYGVRVNCVSPGGVLDAKKQSSDFIEAYSEKSPMKRLGNPKEIAGPIVFLLSEEASYITGHNLMVDGGWTAI